MREVFAIAEADHKNRIYSATWGHLYPEPKVYQGSIRVMNTPYDGICILQENIPGIHNSPWWYETVHQFIHEQEDDIELGQVFEYHVKVSVEEEHEEEDTSDWTEEDFSDAVPKVHIHRTMEIQKLSRQYLLG